MNSLVIDASLTAAWFFDDEGDPRADAALNFVEEAGAFVPQLWHLEIRNVLLVAERRGRISPDQARDRLNSLRRLPIRTDAEPDLDSALDLARAYGLSFYDALYDALYLELAKRRDAALASLDTALLRAAASEGPSLTAE